MLDRLEHYLSGKIIKYLETPTVRYAPFFAPDPSVVRAALQPGDILLVEGNTRLAAIIKFLTQSTWSHAALYVGERLEDRTADGEPKVLLEADADTGVVTVPLSDIPPLSHAHLPPGGTVRARKSRRSSITRWRASASNTTPNGSSTLRAICFPIRQCRCGFAAACWRSVPAIPPRRSARR